MRWFAVPLGAVLALGTWQGASAQAGDDVMSQAEVESLRDTADSPVERIKAYAKILDAREHRLDELLAKPRRPGFVEEMHDALEQFGAIADELNDNLDEYGARHRDVRKALPKLIEDTERWATALRAAGDDQGYKVVRRTALDNVKDMQETAGEMRTQLADYFKEHPDAEKAEKARAASPHAPS